jgi:hypothetical protein
MRIIVVALGDHRLIILFMVPPWVRGSVGDFAVVLMFDIDPGAMSRVICVAVFKFACCTDLHKTCGTAAGFEASGKESTPPPFVVLSRRFAASEPTCKLGALSRQVTRRAGPERCAWPAWSSKN